MLRVEVRVEEEVFFAAATDLRRETPVQIGRVDSGSDVVLAIAYMETYDNSRKRSLNVKSALPVPGFESRHGPFILGTDAKPIHFDELLQALSRLLELGNETVGVGYRGDCIYAVSIFHSETTSRHQETAERQDLTLTLIPVTQRLPGERERVLFEEEDKIYTGCLLDAETSEWEEADRQGRVFLSVTRWAPFPFEPQAAPAGEE